MDVIRILFDVVLIGLVLYYIFGKSYVSEKGKNLATKEDIGVITKEIETVKNEIIISSQRKNEFIKEGKNVALTFNDEALLFTDYSSKVVEILVNNRSNLELIHKQIEDIRSSAAKLNSAFHKLYIYFEDCPMRQTAEVYYVDIVKLLTQANRLLFQMEQSAQKESVLMDSFKQNGQLELIEQINSIITEGRLIFEAYMKERKSILENEVYKSREVFLSELSSFIKSTT